MDKHTTMIVLTTLFLLCLFHRIDGFKALSIQTPKELVYRRIGRPAVFSTLTSTQLSIDIDIKSSDIGDDSAEVSLQGIMSAISNSATFLVLTTVESFSLINSFLLF